MLNITVTPVFLAVTLLIAVAITTLLIWLYRCFPVHLIYRSKVGFESMLDAVNEPLAVISANYTVRPTRRA